MRRARSLTIGKGRVISQSRKAGAQLGAGTKINLVLSLGR
jgi:beta-lactam-binding protein with PASTA domain